jgi:HSP20 family protein
MLARTFETLDELVRRLEPGLADWAGGSMDGSRQPRIIAPMEILKTDSEIIVRVDLPGADPDSIDVTVRDGSTLRVRAERRAPAAGQGEYLRRGFAYGTFEGTVMLPAGIDAGALSARYDAGVLEIRVPHPAVQEVKVPVEAGPGAQKALKAAS